MFSDGIKNDKLLNSVTQAQMAAAVSSSPTSVAARSDFVASGSATPRISATPGLTNIKLTIISKDELERLRQHNRILRSNNISIFRQRNQLEARILAAEQREQQLEQQCASEEAGRLRAEEAIRGRDGVVARLQRELQEAKS